MATSTSTLINPLSAQASSYDAATHELVLTKSDFDGETGNTHTVTFSTALALSASGAESTIQVLSFEVTRPWISSDATLVSLTVILGDASDTDEYLTVRQIGDVHASNVTRASGAGTGIMPITNATLQATFAGTAGKELQSFTDGELRIRLVINNAAASVNAG